MSWETFLSLIAGKYGEQTASEIEDLARTYMPGERITIRKTKLITPELIDKVAPGKPREAAKKLGVHYTTIYRALNRPRIIR